MSIETAMIIKAIASMASLISGIGLFGFAWFEQDTRKSILLGLLALALIVTANA